nr:ORF1 [Torque teno felis virus]
MFRKRRRFGTRRRWRRGKYFPRWRGYYRRGHHTRRRWRRTVRRQPVSEWIPGRHRYITVTGWEPLGNLCFSDYAATEATPYASIEPQSNVGQWHGSWGRHYFTPGNLMTRAYVYWNKWSEDWGSFDYIKFVGGYVKIPQTATCPWMINFEEYLQVKLKDYNPPNTEDKWDHPGILLNDRKTHLIFPPNIYPRRTMYKIRIKPPPGWKGFQRLPDALGYVCCHWVWTWWDPTHAFYDIGQDSSSQHTCQQSPWWGGQAKDKQPQWVDRTKYPPCSNNQQQQSWGPFLPCVYGKYPECSLFFLYKMRFKVVGNALWRRCRATLSDGGLVPPPPGQNGHHAETQRASPKRKRPESTYDVWPGDLDSEGILKEKALRRITGAYTRSKRQRLGDTRRLKHLAKKLRAILRQRGLLRMGDVDPPLTPPPMGGSSQESL